MMRPIPFYDNARPCSMYRNGVKVVGYEWDEKSGSDVLFENTYNDRVDLSAFGKSKQNAIPSLEAPSPIISSLASLVVADKDGDEYNHELPVLRGIPNGAGGWSSRDEAYIENGHLMVLQRIGHALLTGNEHYTTVANSGYANFIHVMPSTNSYYPNPSTANAIAQAKLKQLTSHFSINNAYNSSGDDIAWVFNTPASGGTLRIRCTQWGSTANEVKAKCAELYANGVPVEHVYELLTPIIHDLGPINLPSYYPHTRILASGTYIPDLTILCRVAN